MPFKLNHLHLKTPDPQQTAQWYVDNLDAKIVSDSAPNTYRLDLHGLPLNVTRFIDGLIAHLTLPGDDSGHAPGVLQNGCFNGPKPYAERSELIWGTAYLLFALYYLKTGQVVE